MDWIELEPGMKKKGSLLIVGTLDFLRFPDISGQRRSSFLLVASMWKRVDDGTFWDTFRNPHIYGRS
jgi:hypothetical protein